MPTDYIFTVPYGAKVEIKYEERRDQSRSMYQYKTSHDPRIRALERRGLNGVERRDGFERRCPDGTQSWVNRRISQRRKA